MQKYKIIASIAKIENNNNNQRLEVIGSFVKFYGTIDFEAIKKTAKFLTEKTKFFDQNSFYILHLHYWDGQAKNFEIIAEKEIPGVKILNVNIFTFIQSLKLGHSLGIAKALNTRKELEGFEAFGDDREIFSLRKLLLRKNMKYKNVILIFDSLSLSNLYILLKTLGITIYGGNSQRRHLLSTVQKSLVMALQLINDMDVSPNTIYESYTDGDMIKGKNVNKIGRLIDDVVNSKDIEEKEKNLSKLNEYTQILSEDVDNFLKQYNDLFGFFVEYTYYALKKNTIEGDLSVLSDRVDNQRAKIKSLNSELEKIEDAIGLLAQSMYQLDSRWFTEEGVFIHDSDLKVDLNKVKPSLGEQPKYSNINTLNHKREYSTFVRNNSCHNIRSNIFNNNKRYLYTNNSIISNKIMELLYSDNNKEVVQRNIEKYLMNEQNNYILQRVSSTSINYSLLSNEISSKIIGSVKD